MSDTQTNSSGTLAPATPELPQSMLRLASALVKLALQVGIAVPISVLWILILPDRNDLPHVLAVLPVMVLIGPIAVLLRLGGSFESLSRSLSGDSNPHGNRFATTASIIIRPQESKSNLAVWRELMDGIARTSERMTNGVIAFNLGGVVILLLLLLRNN